MKKKVESLTNLQINTNYFVSENIIAAVNTFLSKKEYASCQLFILSDFNTHKHCLPILLKSEVIKKNLSAIFKIAANESDKTLKVCETIWKDFAKHKADRNTILINVGGGLVSDLGGFCASIYKRGIKVINIPTTLLAQVDACIGGKVAVNFDGIKNLLGQFYKPEANFICPIFLKTLPKKELLAGFAEIIKHALICDKAYWLSLQQISVFNINNLHKIITRSIKIKNNIILKDPYDNEERKKLNFGHTIGHGIESFSLLNKNKKLLHGEAIAIGIICESYLSFKKGFLTKNELNNISGFILKWFNKYSISSSNFKLILQFIHNDKKNVKSKINFTFLNRIGNSIIDQYCTEKEIIDSLIYYQNLEIE